MSVTVLLVLDPVTHQSDVLLSTVFIIRFTYHHLVCNISDYLDETNVACARGIKQKESINVKNVKMNAIYTNIHYYLKLNTQTTITYLTMISSAAFTMILKITNQEKRILLLNWDHELLVNSFIRDRKAI